MRKEIFVLPLLLLLACNNKKAIELTPQQQLAKVDSIVKQQQKWIKEQESERLRDRISIEVKEKTDSILASYKAAAPTPMPQAPPQTPTDTLSSGQVIALPIDSTQK